MFVRDDAENLYALDAATGAEQWRFVAEGSVSFSSPPAVAEGVLYIGGSDGSLYALDGANGSQRWSFPIEGGISSGSGPVVANGMNYIGGNDGFLYAVGGEAGTGAAAPPAATILPIEEGVTVEINADGVVLRGAPSAGAVEIEALPKGTRLTVLGSREEREGTIWWRVQVIETGATGFVEEQNRSCPS